MVDRPHVRGLCYINVFLIGSQRPNNPLMIITYIKLQDTITQERPVLYGQSQSESEEEEYEYMEIKPKEKWDCESILSQNSTLYNHPKMISAPPVSI